MYICAQTTIPGSGTRPILRWFKLRFSFSNGYQTKAKGSSPVNYLTTATFLIGISTKWLWKQICDESEFGLRILLT